MSVFTCVADESADQNPRRNYFYGGFAAPEMDWDVFFAPAWKERVLDGPPTIPYLHIADFLDRKWCERHGLSPRSANHRLDEAARVIRSMGSLIPVMVFVDQAMYERILRSYEFRAVSTDLQRRLDPDYVLFIYFAAAQLHRIHAQRPEAERVNFCVEQNGPITRFLRGFHNVMADTLTQLKHPELAALVGEFRSVGKEYIPAQAADMLAWHARRNARGALDREGTRRYWRMVEGGFGSSRGRYGYRDEFDPALMQSLADGFDRLEQGRPSR